MNVITVSREYGAGGYEVAHRLAEVLGWELLDRELLHRAAAVEHLPDAELERLDEKAGRIEIVDLPERVEPLLAALGSVIGEGLVTVSDVHIMKYLPDPSAPG